MKIMHRKPFAVIPEWVVLAAEPTALKVYAVLASHYANGDRVCFPKQETVAEFAGLSASTVKRSIAQLVKLGAVEAKRTMRGSKRGHNVYYLPLIKGQICPPVDDEYGSDLTSTFDSVGGADDPSITIPTKDEPDPSPGAAAPDSQIDSASPPGLFELEPTLAQCKNGTGETAVKELNKRAVLLAQAHYDRLDGHANLKALIPMIKKFLAEGRADADVDAALAYIAEHNWGTTAERVYNVLKGGPKLPSRPPLPAGVDLQERNERGDLVYYPNGKKIVYDRNGMVLDL